MWIGLSMSTRSASAQQDALEPSAAGPHPRRNSVKVLWEELGLRTSCSEVRRPGLPRLPRGLEREAPGELAHRSPATSGARSPALTLAEFNQGENHPSVRLLAASAARGPSL